MEPGKLNQMILVVDDDYAVRKLVKIVLETEGYDVLTADGAETAMNAIRPVPGCAFVNRRSYAEHRRAGIG